MEEESAVLALVFVHLKKLQAIDKINTFEKLERDWRNCFSIPTLADTKMT